jgi:cell division septum initiation protein DivIVA
MLDQANRERRQIEEDIKARIEATEQELMARHQRATAESQANLAEAKTRADDINRQATELASESEALLQRSSDKASEIIEDARTLAAGLLDQAKLRADELNARTQLFTEQMITRAKEKLASSQDDAFLLKDFIDTAATVSTTDAVIAELEENLRRENQIKPLDASPSE